ncbi:MAG: Rrf2 family transcriptional regulator [Bacteroidia bacterium]|nr:Rrf2 family transcriptional regulator [Bacteroidia bacterium]
MSASTKLFTAIQALCFLAEAGEHSLSSEELSRRMGTHPSRLRNILSMLVRGGVVRSTRGSAGGFLLAKPARAIHLQEVYCSVETEKAFHLDVGKGNASTQNDAGLLHAWFLDLFADIQIRIEDEMRGITLAQVLERIQSTVTTSQLPR